MKRIATTPVTVDALTIGGQAPLIVIAGPCVIEDWDTLCRCAEALRASTAGLPLTPVFKASYDKANRSNSASYRGPGLAQGLPLLEKLKHRFDLPVTSDIHTPEEARCAAEVLDILQIPAFLCRQNDLLQAAGASGRLVNIKKGQYMSPGEMPNRIRAAAGADGESRAIITERGTFFGYNTLVNDFKGVVEIRAAGTPVVFDATHSVQMPGALGSTSGGRRDLAPSLARAACAVGIDGIFMEIHPDPDRARCDGPNSLSLAVLPELLKVLVEIDRAVRT